MVLLIVRDVVFVLIEVESFVVVLFDSLMFIRCIVFLCVGEYFVYCELFDMRFFGFGY